MTKGSTTKIDIAVINANIIDIKEDVKDIKDKLERDYITVDQFDPVKKIVYGLVALILTSVVGALVALILK